MTVDWPSVQLRRVARFAYGDSLADASREPGSVAVYGSNGPVGQHSRSNTQGPALVIGRKGSFGKVHFSAEPVFAIDTTFFVDRRNCRNDLRWLYYASSTLGLDQLSEDVGVPGLSRGKAYSQRVALPPFAAQRAIADFLDAETARIDALIAKKRRLIALLGERRVVEIDSAFTRPERLVAVRRLTDRITSGPRGWAQYVADNGTMFLRITNIDRRSIELDLSDSLFVQAPKTAEARRTDVRLGDVLVSITADIGSVGVARQAHVGANISQHVALLSPTGCEPEWLAYAIRSTPAQAQLDAGQYGGTKTQLNLGDIADLKVPVPDLATQRAVLRKLDENLVALDRCAAVLRRQIDLLAEHRQALVTAAVTGELEIPGVAA